MCAPTHNCSLLSFGFHRSCAVVLGFLLSGCSIDGIGASVSDVTIAGDGLAVRTLSFGLALRTVAHDRGLSLGYTESFVLSPGSGSAATIGRHLFGIRESQEPERLLIRRVFGLDVAMNHRVAGVALGFLEDAVLARVPAQQTIARRAVLDRAAPERSGIWKIDEVAP